MAETQEKRAATATRLAQGCAYIVDEHHASGPTRPWCAENCMPKLTTSAALLKGFPANICEKVNSELSPLGHTIHLVRSYDEFLTLL